MKRSNLLQKYYDTQCEQIRQLIIEKCKTVGQHTAICTMALERCNMQIAFLEKQFPALNELSMYRNILDDMEQFTCNNRVITPEMGQEYEDWCIQMEELLEHQHFSYQSHWQLQLLPGMIELLGTFFSSGTPPHGWDTVEGTLIGFWFLFHYETGYRYPDPKKFNFYAFIRLKHSDIEAIGQERDALRLKLSKSVRYRDAYESISDIYKNECQKYWSEAAAEQKRLIENAQPMTVEKLIFTPKELNRIRADVQFVTTETTTNEDIRQRLHCYRTLDIASENPAANGNGI